MEIPRLGVEYWSCSCRPTPQPQQCEIWDTSVTYTQLMAMLDPWPTEQGQGSNLHPHGYQSDLFLLCHNRNSLDLTFKIKRFFKVNRSPPSPHPPLVITLFKQIQYSHTHIYTFVSFSGPESSTCIFKSLQELKRNICECSYQAKMIGSSMV